MGITWSPCDPDKPFENRVLWPPYRDIYIMFNVTASLPPQPLGLVTFVTGLGVSILDEISMYDELRFLSADTSRENSRVPYENIRGINEGPPQVCLYRFVKVHLQRCQFGEGAVLNWPLASHQKSVTRLDCALMAPTIRKSEPHGSVHNTPISHCLPSHIAVRDVQASAVVLRRHGLPCTLMQA
jgi:hypothetical protein